MSEQNQERRGCRKCGEIFFHGKPCGLASPVLDSERSPAFEQGEPRPCSGCGLLYKHSTTCKHGDGSYNKAVVLDSQRSPERHEARHTCTDEFPPYSNGCPACAADIPRTLQDYRDAPSRIGPCAYDWSDKPHRVLFDLCNAIEKGEIAPQPPPEAALDARIMEIERRVKQIKAVRDRNLAAWHVDGLDDADADALLSDIDYLLTSRLAPEAPAVPETENRGPGLDTTMTGEESTF